MFHVIVQTPLGRQQLIAPETLGDIGRVAEKLFDHALKGLDGWRRGTITAVGGRLQPSGKLILKPENRMNRDGNGRHQN